MFATGSGNRGFAIDLLTGRSVWRYSSPVPNGVQGCCGTVNRGFAAQGDRLFKMDIEANLVALDAKTGGGAMEKLKSTTTKKASAPPPRPWSWEIK